MSDGFYVAIWMIDQCCNFRGCPYFKKEARSKEGHTNR